MKLSRDDLKQIVKECIVEIFSESFNKDSLQETKNKNQVRRQPIVSQQPINKPRHNPALNLIKTGDPILDSVMADTARTTLPVMLEADSNRTMMPAATGTAEKVVAASDPENLFGEEVAAKWAALAFSDFSGKS